MNGSKIDNLILLKENGINVPDFFVVTNKEEKIENNLKGKLFAVRSSCNLEDGNTNSFAGQFDTYLNVPKKEVEQKIQMCFSSLNNSNVLEYAKKNNIYLKDIKMNVIVQEMISSEISGVLFTSNPQGILNESVIVSSLGLGENVVQDKGEVTSYYYNNTDKVYYYEGKDILTKKQIEQLIDVSIKIKELLGEYLDIEFAFKDNKLYILQARKITTIDDSNPSILDNSNIVESYPNISLPLTISFVNKIYSNIFRRLVTRVVKKEKELEKLNDTLNHMTSSSNGRVYYKISNWYTLFNYIPFNKKLIAVWQDMLGVKNKKITTNNIRVSKFRRFKVLINYIGQLKKSQKNMTKLNEEFLRINTYYKEHFNENLSNEEIIKLYKEVEIKVLNNWDITLVNDMYAFLFTALLKKNLKKKNKDYENIVNEYITGISNIESLKPIKELINLSYNKDKYSSEEFNKLKYNYIDLYGDRSLEELKLESKTFRTNPELLDKRIEEYREDLEKLKELYLNINNSSKTKLKESFKIRFLTKRINSGIRNREISRLNRSRLFGMVREMLLTMGNNLVKEKIIDNKYDVFYLEIDEVFNIDKKVNYKELIKERKNKYKDYYLLPAYSRLIFMDKEFDKSVKKVSVNKEYNLKEELKGTPASFGIVEAEALVITNINEIKSTKDKILITKMTDPGWVFLIANAKGIISEKGSLLSHTAIISRELKIPSIVGVDNLMKSINTGDIVRMNANTGEIKIVKRRK